MSTNRRIWLVCIGAGLPALLIALLLITGVGSVPDIPVTPLGYEDRIFKTDRIYSIDIRTDDWKGFLQSCEQGAYTNCTVFINAEPFENVGVCAEDVSSFMEVSDSGSCRYSLRLDFDYYDSEQRYYGLDALKLNNLLHDNTMMKEHLTYRLMAELGADAPLSNYTRVYVNGKSLGLYLAVEAMEESFLLRNYGSDYGKLYTPETDGSHTGSASDVKLQYLGDDPEYYPNIFNNAKTDLSPEDKARLTQSLKQLSTSKKLRSTVDIEAVTRYFAIHSFVCNADSYTGPAADNYCLYEKDGRLSMLPQGYNLAFGGSTTGDAFSVVNSSIYAPVFGGTHSDRPMLARILENRNYTWLYERYHIELLNTDMETLVKRTQAMIAPYVLRDPTKFCTYEEFENGVDALLAFLELRSESIQLQLRGTTAQVDVGDLDLSAMGGEFVQPVKTQQIDNP